MAALSPRERALIVLYELEGWSLAELSVMTGRTGGSLKTRLSRLRTKMREELTRYLNGSGVERTVTGKETVCIVTKPARD